MKKILIVALFSLSLSYSFSEQQSLLSCEKVSDIAQDNIVATTFSISNLGCGGDAAAMQKKIAESKGVRSCTVNASTGTAVVKYDSTKISKEELTEIIENCSLCHDKNAKPFKVKKAE